MIYAKGPKDSFHNILNLKTTLKGAAKRRVIPYSAKFWWGKTLVNMVNCISYPTKFIFIFVKSSTSYQIKVCTCMTRDLDTHLEIHSSSEGDSSGPYKQTNTIDNDTHI